MMTATTDRRDYQALWTWELAHHGVRLQTRWDTLGGHREGLDGVAIELQTRVDREDVGRRKVFDPFSSVTVLHSGVERLDRQMARGESTGNRGSRETLQDGVRRGRDAVRVTERNDLAI